MRRLTREAALADDLAQETFMKALGRLSELQKPDAAKAWLFSIAYRCFLDSYKKTARRAQLSQETLPEIPAAKISGLGLDIERAMTELPEDCRACVMLSLSEGYSHPEIAHITGLPLGTVKSHVARGKTKLKAALAVYRNPVNDPKVDL